MPSASTSSQAFHTESSDPLRRGDGLPQSQPLLSGIQSAFALCKFRSFLHLLGRLGQDHLDVARIAHVRVDTAVSAVCSSTLLGCLVDLNVLDDQVGGVEAFGIGIRFGVLEEAEKKLGRLDWMPGS